MPGLLRGVARTAVVAGTASAVSGRVQRRQNQRWAEEDAAQQPQQPQAVSETPAADDDAAQLEKLAKLKDEGVITEDEFNAKKKQILGI